MKNFEQEPLPIGRNDPVLKELWAVKAQINKEAGYDVGRLVEQAQALDIEALMRRVAESARNGESPSTEELDRSESAPLPIGRNDPILRELWAIKAQINAEAGYCVRRLLEQAHSMGVEAVARRLREAADPSLKSPSP